MSYPCAKTNQLLLLNIAIGLGTFIQVLDTSIANVSIPYIAGSLNVSAEEGTWVVTAFAASNAIVLPLTGWLSDYFGRVRLFVWSVLLFSFVSFLCGLATSLTMLVFLRILQGGVAGCLIPLSQSLVVASNPPEKRGTAFGFWNMIVVVAPVLGPIVGGYLTEFYSWPWIFYINVPIGLFSALTIWYYLRKCETPIVRYPIDWFGLCLLTIGVGCLQIMLDTGKSLGWFSSSFIITLLVIAFIALFYFAIWSYFQDHPIVDFSFFKDRNFAVGTIAITLGFLIYFGSTVTIPLWLQTQQGYTPYWAGIAVAPIGVLPFFLSTTIGNNIHRIDIRWVAATSFLLFAATFWYQTHLTTHVDLKTIMWMRLLQGCALAIFSLPLTLLALEGISQIRYASASCLFHFIRLLVGSGFGTSLFIQLWTRLETFHYARLAENWTNNRETSLSLYQYLSSYNPSFTPQVTDLLLDQQIQQQAYLLAMNDLFWLGSWLFLLMVPVFFLCKPIILGKVPNHTVNKS